MQNVSVYFLDPSASLERRYTVNELGSNAERHRRKLLIHCYRMLGSLPDAEDAVQTLLLAWRYRDSLKEGAPLRFPVCRNGITVRLVVLPQLEMEKAFVR